METIKLTENGVYPIKYDIDGNLIEGTLETELNIPGSIQGEGKLIGVPSLFIRLTGCNLRCAWLSFYGHVEVCDKPFTSFEPEVCEYKITDVIKLVKNNLDNINHVVITGGEPLIQFKPLRTLVRLLKEELGVHITLETNGTIFDYLVSKYVDLISLSPKLKTSIPLEHTLKNTKYEFNKKLSNMHTLVHYNKTSFQYWVDQCYPQTTAYHAQRYKHRSTEKDFQFKFVISDPSDIGEIKIFYKDKIDGLTNSDIILMPLGSDLENMQIHMKIAIVAAIKYNWRISSRLQVDLWDNKKNV